jgi:membrane associated rhomboid family serine protease
MHVAEKGEPMPALTLGEGKNMVTQLILVNLTVFILLFFIQIIYNIEGNSTIRFNVDVLNNIVLPADPSRLIRLPWTFLTTLFINNSVWSIFSSMIWLWAIGYVLQRKTGPGIILPLYLFGGFVGNIFYLVGMQLIPAFRSIQFFSFYDGGSSACIMAIAVALLMTRPNLRLYPRLSGGIPMWTIVVAYIVISVVSNLFTLRDQTNLPAIIGGALTGYLYMNAWKKGKDWGAGFNKALHRVTHIFDPKETPDLKIYK